MKKFTEALNRGLAGRGDGELTLGSPLEQENGFVSQIYENLLITYATFLSYTREEMVNLKKIYGDNLTKEIVFQFFEINPFKGYGKRRI